MTVTGVTALDGLILGNVATDRGAAANVTDAVALSSLQA